VIAAGRRMGGPWSLLQRFQAVRLPDEKLSRRRGSVANTASGNENMTVSAS